MKNTEIRFLRRAEVLKRAGYSNSTLHQRIDESLFPPSINLGGRAVGWLEHEVSATLSAFASGKTLSSVQELVKGLIAKREELSLESRK